MQMDGVNGAEDKPIFVAENGNWEFDLFVIGIGSGGTRAARIASQSGAKVGAVELAFDPVSSEHKGGVGGTCVLRGCVPKKILVYGSAFSAELHDARGYGWNVPDNITFNWNHLIEQKTKEIERLNGVYKKLLNNAKVQLFEGRGTLVDDHTVELTMEGGKKERHTARYILIATGGRAQVLDIPGKEHVITSDEALALPKLPRTIAIVGGGYIAVEFTGIFKGCGSDVHLIFRQPTPLRGFDEEARGLVAENLKKRNVHLHPNASPTKVEKLADDKYVLHLNNGEKVEVELVMFATGRKANTANMNLEGVGVELDKKGAVKVSPWSQSSIPSIFAVGDVTDRINLTPVALMEGQCFSKSMFANELQKPDHKLVASAVFCQPPLAHVGLTEQQALEEAKSDVLVFTSSFRPMKHIVAGRDEKTFMKMIVDSGTDKVLGLTMVGPDGPEIMQSVAIALKAGATKRIFDSTVGIHPTAAEELVTMRTPSRRLAPGSKAPGLENA